MAVFPPPRYDAVFVEGTICMNELASPREPSSAYTFVNFLRLSPKAIIPVYATPGSTGLDLSACLLLDGPLVIDAHDSCTVGTGLALEIPLGFEGQIRSRSGLARKHKVVVLNSPGTIDSDYRGEICVILINHGKGPYTINNGDRIAQLVIAPVTRAVISEVKRLDTTTRGSGGFGSTGV